MDYMEKIINTLFSEYLSEQKISKDTEYTLLRSEALQREKELRNKLNEEQIACFEELFEISSQIHFLEVKDAFESACKLGANASKEFSI
jgi:hypothetical protein